MSLKLDEDCTLSSTDGIMRNFFFDWHEGFCCLTICDRAMEKGTEGERGKHGDNNSTAKGD